MKKHHIIVIGGGGHAKVVIDILKMLRNYEIIGYCDVQAKGSILGVEYLGSDKQLRTLKNKFNDCQAVIAIGSIDISNINKRRKIKEKLEQLGFDLPVVISPNASISKEVDIGRGTVVCSGAVINPGTKIGECVVVNTSSSIDHDCVIGDFAHICPGSTLCGDVKIGQDSIVGAGSTIIQYINICEKCIIGAGAVVTENCRTSGTYLGIPAKRKIISNNEICNE